ncbi:hypothetical protein [Nocardia sp. NPDC004415]
MTLTDALITAYTQTPEVGRTSRQPLALELVNALEANDLLALQLAFSVLVT